MFPFVGALTRPSKQSVVLWWNMDKAGGYDVLSWHAGCPVMSGNKWVLNKWLSINSLMFRKPCPAYTETKIRQIQLKGRPYQIGELFQEP